MAEPYDASLSLREARALYLERNHIAPDGGESQRWVKVTRKRLPLYLLNTAPRRRAVPYHDLHHVLTGYETSNAGEAEISAWELAAGTRPHWFALFIDLAGAGVGLGIAPARSFRAFVRGRRCRSLYAEPLTEELLSSSVESVRQRLGLGADGASPTGVDLLLFALTSAAALLTLAALVVLAPLFILVGLFMQ